MEVGPKWRLLSLTCQSKSGAFIVVQIQRKLRTEHTRNYKSATQYDAAEDAGRPAL